MTRKQGLFTLVLVVISLSVKSQWITHGPVIGGVKPDEARMYVRTDTVRGFALQLSPNQQFNNPLIVKDTTEANRDTSTIINITGLQSGTNYYYRLVFNGQIDKRKGSFTTFPPEGQEGHYTFVTGSCQETANMKVFDAMPTHNPDLFIHTGDFTYPSYQLDNTYPSDYETVQLSWQKRYEEKKMNNMLLDMPIDYIPDDDDMFGSTGRHYNVSVDHVKDSTGTVTNFFKYDTITPQMRRNVWKGYVNNFPGYSMNDTSVGLYHSFNMGNCEFFFLDTRSAKDPVSNAFQYDSASNQWSFVPDSTHSIIGDQQMTWLLNQLDQSTADWKFLVSGLPFNKSNRRLIDVGMDLQNLQFDLGGSKGTGMTLAGSFANFWAGYPSDQKEILDHLEDNGFTNVIAISGHTHYNVMDDGTNAGLPELNASGLSVSSTDLIHQLDSVSQLLGNPSLKDSLWNQGGNGLGNQNFNNGFGKIEVFEDDSVQLCVYDETNTKLNCFTVKSPRYVKNERGSSENKDWIVNLFPNPAQDKLFIHLSEQALRSEALTNAYVANTQGKVVQKLSNEKLQDVEMEVDISSLAPGRYNLIIRGEEGSQQTRPFVIQR